jgi:hypothetical protein
VCRSTVVNILKDEVPFPARVECRERRGGFLKGDRRAARRSAIRAEFPVVNNPASVGREPLAVAGRFAPSVPPHTSGLHSPLKLW